MYMYIYIYVYDYTGNYVYTHTHITSHIYIYIYATYVTYATCYIVDGTEATDHADGCTFLSFPTCMYEIATAHQQLHYCLGGVFPQTEPLNSTCDAGLSKATEVHRRLQTWEFQT